MMAPMTQHEEIELATRKNAGVEVKLIWRKNADDLKIVVADERTGETYEAGVSADRGLDAFYHPFAYLAP